MASPEATRRSAPRSRSRWLHHLYRAGCRSHSQQHRPAHHHQRRQSSGLHLAKHLGDESHSDSHLRHAHGVRSRDQRPSCSPARIHQRREVLVNGSPAPTTFNSGAQLTANVDLTEPGNLDLQVLNPAPGPATSADLIATVSGTPPVPIVSPRMPRAFLSRPPSAQPTPTFTAFARSAIRRGSTSNSPSQPTPTEPAVEQALIVNNPPCASTDVKCNAALFVQNSANENLVQDTFWQQSLTAPDQLRERVKYALSQLFVISSDNTTRHSKHAARRGQLLRHARR